jgi:hypothetical protein
MLLTELSTARIPDVYQQFAAVIGDCHWRSRFGQLKQEIRGNRFLAQHLESENALAYQFDHLRELTGKFGRVPPWEANNHAVYPAASFAAQVLSIMEASPRQFSEQLRRRIHGAFKNPDDMRGLRLELSAATHFARRTRKLAWPEMTGEGTFDLLVQDVGPRGLEIECKAISEDKGRKIHKREVLDFYRLLWPHIQSTIKGLSTGLSAVLTVPGRLPSQHADRVALARQYGAAIFTGGGVALPDGSSVRIAEFDVARLGDIPSSTRPSEVRAAIDEVTETNNRQVMVIGTHAGGALALTVQSGSDDTFMKAVFDTLSDSAKRQLSGVRGGMFLVGFHGIDGEQLLSVAGQDQDAAQSPTALRMAVSRFLASAGRDQVVGVGFLSESALAPVQDGLVESGGTAYYFPKRESPLWSEDFSGLFQWMPTPVDQAP